MTQKCCPGPKFNPVTHVIFDLDGTILDTEEISVNAITEIAAQYGKTCENEIFTQISGSREQDTAEKAINLLDLPLTPEEFLKKHFDLSQAKLADAPLMPGVEKMIRHLHANNIPMAVATSSNQEGFDLKIKNHMDLFELFNHYVCGGTDPEVTRGKPFPDIFLICASRFPDNPDPSKCLVFEDAPNGVQGALSAGMQVVMIPNERVPYELWKVATLRLDNFDFMVPGAFGLPPFPSEEGDSSSPVIAELDFPTEEEIPAKEENVEEVNVEEENVEE